MTNEDRCTVAQIAVTSFQAACPTDDEDAIADLITDLLHLANKTGITAMTALRRGVSNYVAEALDPSEALLTIRTEIVLAGEASD